jgi:hypothetical protein
LEFHKKGGNMLELFKGKIPEIDKLVVLIQKKINSPRYTLEDIKDVICDHISEHKVFDGQDDCDKAESTAFNAINNLIDDLEVNVTNYKRIKEFLLSYHSYNGFNRLIVDFHMFLNKRELLHLIDQYSGLIKPKNGNRLKK